MAWKTTFQVEQLIEEEDVEVEDSGCAKIVELSEYGTFFIRLHSWDINKKHNLFNYLVGKSVRVTVEIEDEQETA